MRHGRRKPYTIIGLKRLPCHRCGEPATKQWQAFTDGLWQPVCTKCHMLLSDLALLFMGDDDIDVKMAKYQEMLK